ncbi:helix-turn-helix transcriptional regulator [Litoricolaceae bacterium]|nr:helix-turn-helix transcriptional regulator [Litorivicinaceae bacterium]
MLKENRKIERACPVGLAAELVCDKWMPVLLRDIGLFELCSFNQILKNNAEGISSGTLAARLKRLEYVGVIGFAQVNDHSQKKIYYLTESGIDLMPVLFALAAWSCKWQGRSEQYGAMIKRYNTPPNSEMKELQAALRRFIPSTCEVN